MSQSRVPHQAEHRPVVGEDAGGEVGDAVVGRVPGELANQPAADPAPVVAVGDLDGDLGVVGPLR